MISAIIKNHILDISLIALLTLILFNPKAKAQNGGSEFFKYYQNYNLSNWSIGVGTGFTVFNHDLGNTFNGQSQNNFVNFFGTITLSHRVTNYFSLRGGASLYKLYAKPGNGLRNPLYAERDPVTSLNSEIYFAGQFDLVHRGKIDQERGKWNVYLLAGAGLTLFEPKNAITKEKLRPTSEEEALEEDKYLYANLMPILPMGGGVSYYFANNQALSFEVMYRLSFSDWMDDTSGRKFPAIPNYDGYFFVGFHYQYTFLSNGKSFGKFSYKKYRRRTRR